MKAVRTLGNIVLEGLRLVALAPYIIIFLLGLVAIILYLVALIYGIPGEGCVQGCRW